MKVRWKSTIDVSILHRRVGVRSIVYSSVFEALCTGGCLNQLRPINEYTLQNSKTLRNIGTGLAIYRVFANYTL